MRQVPVETINRYIGLEKKNIFTVTQSNLIPDEITEVKFN